MSSDGNALKFWEHPDMAQLMEFVCIDCMAVFHLARTKNQPYPFRVECAMANCKNGIALPTQEKQDWLPKKKASSETDSSPEKPNPSTD